ncbi:MAG: VTT domain-containing protein [Planctomycetota bacterium]
MAPTHARRRSSPAWPSAPSRAPGVALAAIAGAAWVGFATLRPLYAAREELLADRPRGRTVHAALVGESGRRAATLVALLRLSPVMPFAGTNLVMAAAGLRTRDFLFGSIIGLAPRVVAVAIAGAGLSELDLSRAGDVRLAILGVVALVLAFVLSARFARRALREAAPAAS